MERKSEYLSYILVIIFLLIIILPVLGISFNFVFRGIEWATKFLLPWIFLYWLITIVEVLKKSNIQVNDVD